MKVLLEIEFDNDAFRKVLEEGRLREVQEKLLSELQPEAVYLTADGGRTNYVVVEIEEQSELIEAVEPFYLTFDADVTATPVMTPEATQEVDIDEILAKWG